jgi:hypothetical protein
MIVIEENGVDNIFFLGRERLLEMTNKHNFARGSKVANTARTEN